MAGNAEEAAACIDQGSLAAIFDDTPGRVQQPLVQCVQVKPIAPQSGAPGASGAPDAPPPPERFRVVFSDIQNYVQTMLATPANVHVTQGGLRRGCFVRLKSYQANAVKKKKILIVMDLEVIKALGECDKIGEPNALEGKQEEESKSYPTTISSSGFYGNKPQQQQTQSRAMPTHTKTTSSSAHANIYPIEALSPYAHKWTIKARCTSKSDIKTWHNRNGEGKLFSANFLDESGEIRGTGFNDQCDRLYDVIQEGAVYYISSPCRIQIAKKQFSNLSNDYELTFDRDTVVEKAEEQDGVPQVRFNFTPIGDLQSVEKDTTTDVVGILKDVGETSQIVAKTTSKPYDKRELGLVDQTGFSVRLTVWGKTASNFDIQPGSVVAFKGVKVSDFGGRSLSLLSSGSMTADPDIDEAHKLKGWWDAQGNSETFNSYANMQLSTMGVAGGRGDPFKTTSQVKDEQLGMTEEKPDYFAIKASIVYIKQDNVAYPACLSEGCNKKVVEVDPGQWRCERCDKTHPKPKYRYIMSINVSDYTGQLWLSCFDEVGRMIMGKSADELMEIREIDEKKFSEVFQEANCTTWNFKCRAKMDNFQEQQRVRYQVSSASPLDFVRESAKLAELIKQYNID